MNDLIGHLYSLGVTINRKLPVANVLQILRQYEIPPICKTVTQAGLHTWSEHTAVEAGHRRTRGGQSGGAAGAGAGRAMRNIKGLWL